MVSIMRFIFPVSSHRGMVALITTIFVLFLVPKNGICLPAEESKTDVLITEILDQAEYNNSDSLVAEFDKFEKRFEVSENPVNEGTIFLNSFIKEINTRYGFALTVPEACKIVSGLISKTRTFYLYRS